MTDLRIRDAVSADTEALLAIYRPFVVETSVSFELEPPSAADFEQRVVAAQSKWAWLVAERGNELLGYAYGSSYRSREVRLHKSLGFGEVGVFRRAGRKFGTWHDVSWWQRELREKPPTEW